VAKKLGCRIEVIPSLNVVVVDGNKVQILNVVKSFTWVIQNTSFSFDIMSLPLGCCDLVLGVEWLVTLGDITWNFDKLTMEFVTQERRHVLRGASNAKLKTVKKQQLHKALSSSVCISMPQLCEGEEDLLLNSLTTHAPTSAMPTSVAELLCSFDDIFLEPTNLPPVRHAHDHKIPLVPGVVPVNKRPYRYAKHQKDIIDGLVKEYLHSGIIQNSSSPYSSPVVLVGKRDCSWRLCVDYKELNKATVKNRFPIPLVDHLLDELYGSKWFSKVDLRSGYN